MKLVLLTLYLISMLNAAELLTFNKPNATYSFCVKSYFIKNNILFYKKSKSNSFSRVNLRSVRNYKFQAGYILKNNKCILNNKSIKNYNSRTNKILTYNNLSELGLSLHHFNFVMSLSGIFCSFLFLYGLFRWI